MDPNMDQVSDISCSTDTNDDGSAGFRDLDFDDFPPFVESLDHYEESVCSADCPGNQDSVEIDGFFNPGSQAHSSSSLYSDNFSVSDAFDLSGFTSPTYPSTTTSTGTSVSSDIISSTGHTLSDVDSIGVASCVSSIGTEPPSLEDIGMVDDGSEDESDTDGDDDRFVGDENGLDADERAERGMFDAEHQLRQRRCKCLDTHLPAKSV